MSNTPYVGGMAAWGSVAAQQRAAEAESAQSEVSDMRASQDGDAIRLEGREGQVAGFGLVEGSAVPNLNVTKVSTPAVLRGVPADAAASQNPLTAARPRAHR